MQFKDMDWKEKKSPDSCFLLFLPTLLSCVQLLTFVSSWHPSFCPTVFCALSTSSHTNTNFQLFLVLLKINNKMLWKLFAVQPIFSPSLRSNELGFDLNIPDCQAFLEATDPLPLKFYPNNFGILYLSVHSSPWVFLCESWSCITFDCRFKSSALRFYYLVLTGEAGPLMSHISKLLPTVYLAEVCSQGLVWLFCLHLVLPVTRIILEIN